MHPSKRIGATLLALVVCSSGCASLLHQLVGVDHRTSRADVEAMNDAGDRAKLEQVCSGQLETKTPDAKEHACQYAAWTKFKADFAAASCDDLRAHYDAYHDVLSHHEKYYFDFGARYAACGHWDIVFEQLVHRGNIGDDADGTVLLGRLADAGLDVGGEFVRYVARAEHPLQLRFAQYAANHVQRFLQHHDKPAYCEPLARKVAQMPEPAQAQFMYYFGHASCRPALPAAVTLLAADDPSARISACQALGKIGGREQIGKMLVLANRDGYWEASDGVKQYPVRDACSQAAAKLELKQ